MATKFHKTPQGIKPCHATTRKCKYEDVSSSPSLPSPESVTLAPVNPLTGIYLRRNSYSEEPYVDYDYDYYACSGCYGCETGDDYCRGSQYEGLRVADFTADDILNQIFEKSPGYIYPSEFYAILEQNGVLNKNNWDVSAEMDYYGETVNGPRYEGANPFPELIDYYVKNADNQMEDTHGYGAYLQSLGYESNPQLSQEEQVKDYVLGLEVPTHVKHRVLASTQMNETTWGALHKTLRQTTMLAKRAQKQNKLLTDTEKNHLTKIYVEPEKMTTVEPSPLPGLDITHPTTSPILGILVKDRIKNSYYLVEGYGYYGSLKRSITASPTSLLPNTVRNYRFLVLS